MKRLLVLAFLLLTIINLLEFSGAESLPDNECKTNPLKTVALRRKLLCDYDPYVRPSEESTTIVKIRLIPKYIEFDDASCTLTVHSWMSLLWDDGHLGWENDQEYSEIKSIHVSSDEIWKPDISVYNSGQIGYEMSGLPSTNCIVTKHKRVTCLPAMKWVTRCTPDYQHWPFDRQNCTVRLGSWIYNQEEINYKLIASGLDMVDYTDNHEWKVLSVNVTRQMMMFKGWAEDHPSVMVNILLERHSTYIKATAIAPAILLIIMTLTVLWLNPMFIERMILAGLNLICHLLCISDLNLLVPFNGSSLPSIMIFHQNSMLMASVAFFLTAVLRQLKEISLPAPVWLTSTTAMFLESRAGQFVLLTSLDPRASATLDAIEDDNAGLVQSNSSAPKNNPGISAWHHLATLIDRLSFFGVLFTYLIMLLVLIPKNDLKSS